MKKTEIVAIRVTKELKEKLTKVAGHPKLLPDYIRKVLEQSVDRTVEGYINQRIEMPTPSGPSVLTGGNPRDPSVATPDYAPNGRPRKVRTLNDEG